jgi:hypothetical protein
MHVTYWLTVMSVTALPAALRMVIILLILVLGPVPDLANLRGMDNRTKPPRAGPLLYFQRLIRALKSLFPRRWLPLGKIGLPQSQAAFASPFLAPYSR